MKMKMSEVEVDVEVEFVWGNFWLDPHRSAWLATTTTAAAVMIKV